MKILIDNGHGADTPGKCSPDKQLREYAYTREIAARIVDELKVDGYDASLLTPEANDVSLTERVRRINSWCDAVGKDNVLVISVHVNAAGRDGQWHNAGGWCCYTSRGQTKSDNLAEWLYDMADIYLKDYKAIMEYGKNLGKYGQNQKPIRTEKSDGDRDYEADFYIIHKSKCQAVLTENLFMDNRDDYDYLLSEYGKASIVNLHVDAIINYIEEMNL